MPRATLPVVRCYIVSFTVQLLSSTRQNMTTPVRWPAIINSVLDVVGSDVYSPASTRGAACVKQIIDDLRNDIVIEQTNYRIVLMVYAYMLGNRVVACWASRVDSRDRSFGDERAIDSFVISMSVFANHDTIDQHIIDAVNSSCDEHFLHRRLACMHAYVHRKMPTETLSCTTTLKRIMQHFSKPKSTEGSNNPPDWQHLLSTIATILEKHATSPAENKSACVQLLSTQFDQPSEESSSSATTFPLIVMLFRTMKRAWNMISTTAEENAHYAVVEHLDIADFRPKDLHDEEKVAILEQVTASLLADMESLFTCWGTFLSVISSNTGDAPSTCVRRLRTNHSVFLRYLQNLHRKVCYQHSPVLRLFTLPTVPLILHPSRRKPPPVPFS